MRRGSGAVEVECSRGSRGAAGGRRLVDGRMKARQVLEPKRGRAQRGRMAGAGGRRGGRGRLGLDLGHGLREERGGSAQDGGRAVSQHPGGLSLCCLPLGVCILSAGVLYAVCCMLYAVLSCMPGVCWASFVAVVLRRRGRPAAKVVASNLLAMTGSGSGPTLF